MKLTVTLSSFEGHFDKVGVSNMFCAMCAWVLLANLQANLAQFRCIPRYVKRRDV